MRQLWLAGLAVAIASLNGIAYAQAERQGATQTTREQPNVSVVGNVEKPGDYPHKEAPTVGAAIERAGGMKKDIGQLDIYVLRVIDGQVKRCRADADTTTQPWDLVSVEKPGGPTPVIYPLCLK